MNAGVDVAGLWLDGRQPVFNVRRTDSHAMMQFLLFVDGSCLYRGACLVGLLAACLLSFPCRTLTRMYQHTAAASHVNTQTLPMHLCPDHMLPLCHAHMMHRLPPVRRPRCRAP